jgi:hypothetical protein
VSRALDTVEDWWAEDGGVLRRDRLHAEATSDDVLPWFLAVMAWGYGSNGQGRPRVAKILNADPRCERITCIRDRALRGAEVGYRALYDTSSTVTGLADGFGTKLLYFAGYRRCEGIRPLILDSRVRAGLAAAGAAADLPTQSLDAYLAYCELAECWADELFPGAERAPSDAVELGLFDYDRLTRLYARHVDPDAPHRCAAVEPPRGTMGPQRLSGQTRS